MTPDRPMRLFIALPLPDKARTALGDIIRDLKRSSASVRWVRPDHIHLTLRFLGDTDSSQVADLSNLIDHAVRDQSVLTLSLDRLGAFPNLRNPRVYWISTSDKTTTDSLCRLADGIEQAVRDLGFEPEKKLFKPHLTLGRVKQRDNLERLGQTIESYRLSSINVPLSEIVLFHSTLTPQGPIYKRLHTAPLGVERFE